MVIVWMNMQQKYFIALNLSSWGSGHLHSRFTKEKQKKCWRTSFFQCLQPVCCPKDQTWCQKNGNVCVQRGGVSKRTIPLLYRAFSSFIFFFFFLAFNGTVCTNWAPFAKTIFHGSLEGGRRRGRQRKCWIGQRTELNWTVPGLHSY